MLFLKERNDYTHAKRKVKYFSLLIKKSPEKVQKYGLKRTDHVHKREHNRRYSHKCDSRPCSPRTQIVFRPAYIPYHILDFRPVYKEEKACRYADESDKNSEEHVMRYKWCCHPKITRFCIKKKFFLEFYETL